jgi:hypothetical protein
MSGLHIVTSANQQSSSGPGEGHDVAVWNKAWASVDVCEAVCKSWTLCVQWSYVEDLCSLDDKLIMGQGYALAMAERKTALDNERLAQGEA